MACVNKQHYHLYYLFNSVCIVKFSVTFLQTVSLTYLHLYAIVVAAYQLGC